MIVSEHQKYERVRALGYRSITGPVVWGGFSVKWNCYCTIIIFWSLYRVNEPRGKAPSRCCGWHSHNFTWCSVRHFSSHLEEVIGLWVGVSGISVKCQARLTKGVSIRLPLFPPDIFAGSRSPIVAVLLAEQGRCVCGM